jgi:hypothetical protein
VAFVTFQVLQSRICTQTERPAQGECARFDEDPLEKLGVGLRYSPSCLLRCAGGGGLVGCLRLRCLRLLPTVLLRNSRVKEAVWMVTTGADNQPCPNIRAGYFAAAAAAAFTVVCSAAC